MSGRQEFNHDSDLPGVPIADWQLYQLRVDQTGGAPVGVKDPEGNYYSFKDGESMVQIKNQSGGRDTFIQLHTGELIPFAEWGPVKVGKKL